MAELRTRKREMRWNDYKQLGLKRILCGSQFTIPDMAGTRPNLESTNNDTRSSRSNQATHTLDMSHQLVSYTTFSSFTFVTLCLVYNTIIIAEHEIMSSVSISPCHNQELTLSTAYTEYSIHQRLLVFPSFLWLGGNRWMYPEHRADLHTWSTANRQLSVRAAWETHFVTLPRLWVN